MRLRAERAGQAAEAEAANQEESRAGSASRCHGWDAWRRFRCPQNGLQLRRFPFRHGRVAPALFAFALPVSYLLVGQWSFVKGQTDKQAEAMEEAMETGTRGRLACGSGIFAENARLFGVQLCGSRQGHRHQQGEHSPSLSGEGGSRGRAHRHL